MLPQFTPCECCRIKWTTTTSTASTYKWSEKECKERILQLAEELANAKWYERGDLRRRLKHWTEKLARYKELKREFN